MTYQERIEAEAKTGYPCWPCPHCGRDSWSVERPFRKSKHDHPTLFPAVCNHCHVIETAHHVDGEWMGMWMYAGRPGSLYYFVQDHAIWMSETK